MLESIRKDEIVAHLDSSNMIGPSQHGFTKGKSMKVSMQVQQAVAWHVGIHNEELRLGAKRSFCGCIWP